jgi:thioredoxin reductase
MKHDVAIIGGSYSGMAAALQLVRARRSVLVIDSGQRRNRFARTSHGFLSQDGSDAAQIAATARWQLEAYPTLTWVEAQASSVTGALDEFNVATEQAGLFSATRVLLATGVADVLPPIAGLSERWGKTVFHCPYCHAYELEEGPIAVLGAGPMSAHQAELLTEWGEVTFLTNNAVALNEETRDRLHKRGVGIQETPITRIVALSDVILADTRRLSFSGLFVAPRCEPASPLAASMGCGIEETLMGLQIVRDETMQTSVPGVYACGDVARAPHSVSFAVGDGAMAGMQLHRSLVWPES